MSVVDNKWHDNIHSPAVSVIVPTFNRPLLLIRAVESILSQTFRDFEVLVVNDAGEDIGGFLDPLKKKGRIVYLRHDENRGLAAARNTGIRAARGKYIAYLDDDDLYYPEHLETLVNFLENRDFKVAYTDTRKAFHELKNGTDEVTSRDDMCVEFDYDYILVGNLIPVLCFMHEKACLDEIGFFDETLTFHEDWDLWIRMSRRFKIAHIRKVTSEFSWRLDGSTMTSKRHPEYLRTLGIIYEKYRVYSEEKPYLLSLQKKNLALQKRRMSGDDWNRREKLKMALSRVIGIRGVNLLYRIKMRLYRE
jgi:glycosyltransferase involved in cell wall biosynthesis